ncbi:MAG: hypothetical protein J6N45_09580 [Alphaproteobacteria bacterium]|nr:hypothetical protein [Alphaproteobacteria bacterium]
MKHIDLTSKPWQMAKIVLDFFKQETTCFDESGNLKQYPRYIVALDDDPISAVYAVKIALKARRQFKECKDPTILCCGGKGMLSKYMNVMPDGIVLSEGEKLAYVVRNFAFYQNIVILDRGNNTGAVVKEIIDYLTSQHDENAPIIFCPTQRMSKRLERTVAFSDQQFIGTLPLNASYYVHGEELEDILQIYNGKGLADGLPLLSEVAALYDRTCKYAGKFMAPLDKDVPPEVVAAGEYLVKHYPIRVSRLPITAPLQFIKMYWAVQTHKQNIYDDLKAQKEKWSCLW